MNTITKEIREKTFIQQLKPQIFLNLSSHEERKVDKPPQLNCDSRDSRFIFIINFRGSKFSKGKGEIFVVSKSHHFYSVP